LFDKSFEVQDLNPTDSDFSWFRHIPSSNIFRGSFSEQVEEKDPGEAADPVHVEKWP